MNIRECIAVHIIRRIQLPFQIAILITYQRTQIALTEIAIHLIIVLCSLPVAVIFIFLVFLNQNSLLPHILQGGEKLFFPVTPTLPQRTADILMICTYHFPSLLNHFNKNSVIL